MPEAADAELPSSNRTPARARPRRWPWIMLAALVMVLLALEAYVRWPSQVPPVPLAVAPGTRELVLIVHGSFGAEEPTLRELERRWRAQAGAGVQVVRHRWAPWSDNILRAGPHGAHLGAALGRELGAMAGLERLHLVAHSAGAYLLDPLCEAWRAARRSRAGGTAPGSVEMTFLDPIGLRGLFERGWGAREFGRCADRAEAYINTDDSAPATDRVLRHARTFDVTRAPGRATFPDGHRWPVQYYLERRFPQAAMGTAAREGAVREPDRPPGRGCARAGEACVSRRS
jgi:hypothetical protein